MRVASRSWSRQQGACPGWSWPRACEQALALGGGTRLPLPGSPRSWPRGSVFPGCPGPPVQRSPGLPGLPRWAVPTQGPRPAVPAAQQGPAVPRAVGSWGLLWHSVVPAVPVSASPASATSGECPDIPAPARAELCLLCPQCPEVLQLSDALRDDILPELGCAGSTTKVGPLAVMGGHRGAARCGWPSRGELLTGPRAPRFTGSTGLDRASWVSRQPLLCLKGDIWGSAPAA